MSAGAIIGETSADVVVLGGGPSGVAAAWHAARTGREVVLLERGPALGGLASSFDVDGVRVDHGSHRLHPATPPQVMADLRALLGDDLQTRLRKGRLLVGGSWVGFPLRPAELARSLPPGMLARIARDAVGEPLRRMASRDRSTYAGALRASLGPALYEALYAPYARKLWGLSGDEIDAHQARTRVTADSPWKVAVRMARQHRGGERGRQGREFLYPRRGFGQIVDALSQAASDAGAVLRTGSEVDAVEVGPGGTTVRAGAQTLRAPVVLSTLPVTVLARLARPAPPGAVVDAARSLRLRGMVLVYLVHGGGRWTPYDAHYLPDGGTPVTRVSEPANYRTSADDPADRSVLCAELPCAPGDPTWSASDADLTAVVVEALRRNGLPPVRVVGAHVRRLPHVYPVYPVGYADAMQRVLRWADTLSGVLTLGRLGLFAHDNTHHALLEAYEAVAALTVTGVDADRWAAARARFRAHVVED